MCTSECEIHQQHRGCGAKSLSMMHGQRIEGDGCGRCGHWSHTQPGTVHARSTPPCHTHAMQAQSKSVDTPHTHVMPRPTTAQGSSTSVARQRVTAPPPSNLFNDGSMHDHHHTQTHTHHGHHRHRARKTLHDSPIQRTCRLVLPWQVVRAHTPPHKSHGETLMKKIHL